MTTGHPTPATSPLRRWLRRQDAGWLVILTITILAIWPFISRESLPQATDAELHIFRLAELSGLIRQGVWYPRWAPNFYHGYGYPIFNYYAPLSYYVGLLVELLPRADAVTGIKAVFVLGQLLAAVGTYGFVRDRWGRLGGYVAAASYLYSPYMLYIDPHARGALAESFSLGIFPMALWSLERLRQQRSGWRWVTAVLWTAALILSHNLMALLCFGFLFAWLVWERLFNRQTARTAVQISLAALCAGVGVATFFWLPVFLERNAVNLNTLIGYGDNYDFRTHFLTATELLAWSMRLDWGATEPAFRFNLGVAQWLLGLLGLTVWGRRLWRRQTAVSLSYFVLALAGLLFLMMPASTWVWESLPFLPFFQFPWRLLGATGLALAVIGGVGVQWLVDDAGDGVKQWLPLTAVLALLLTALPLTQPAPWPNFEEVNVLRMSLIEKSGRWLGTTSTADYIPATVDSMPRRNDEMLLPLFSGGTIDRVNRATLPEGTTVMSEQVTPLHYRYQISSEKQFRLRLFLFAFPGWQVTVDGETAVTELARPDGFQVVVVPAGEHLVDVRFGSTPARTTAVWLSWVTVASVLAVALWFGQAGTAVASPSPGLAPTDRWVLAGVSVMTLLIVGIVHPAGWLHDSSAGLIAEPAERPLLVDLGEQIHLLGVDISNPAPAPGEIIKLTLYWKAQTDLDINYQSFVHLMGDDGAVLAQSDNLNPGEFPTRRWPLDKYVRDEHFIRIPDAAAGELTLRSGIWVQSEGWRLPVLDEAGQMVDDTAVLGTITVR